VTTIDFLEGTTVIESVTSHMEQTPGLKHGTGTSKEIRMINKRIVIILLKK